MSELNDSDPFDAFGDDEEDEEEEDEEILAASSRSRQLRENANRRMKQGSEEPSTSALNDLQPIEKGNNNDVSSLKLATLDWDPPMYLGPIVCVSQSEYGGGRAFVAERDLHPGTLIIVEKPSIEWPKEQIGQELGLVSVLHILEQAEAQKLIHDLEGFHPTKEAVDAPKQEDAVQVRDMIETLERDLGEPVRATVELAKSKGFLNRNGTPLCVRDVVRLLLALRYNGFESGVYLYLAMLNHDCYPNSVKFAATEDYSEVRTTRFVKAGESLTISYLPRITCHASRRHHLWDQHRFDIGKSVPAGYEKVERVCRLIPLSWQDHRDEAAVTFRIECATVELEEHFQEAAESAEQTPSIENPVWELVKALEVSSLELYTEAKDQLENQHHLLLIPCLRLHLDVCDLIQVGKILPVNQHVLLLLRVVTSARNLIELQTLLFGKDHFELAKSYSELAQALAELLSLAPKKLTSLGLDGLSSFLSCSSAEHKARKEFERIRDCYPRDVEREISKAKIPILLGSLG